MVKFIYHILKGIDSSWQKSRNSAFTYCRLFLLSQNFRILQDSSVSFTKSLTNVSSVCRINCCQYFVLIVSDGDIIIWMKNWYFVFISLIIFEKVCTVLPRNFRAAIFLMIGLTFYLFGFCLFLPSLFWQCSNYLLKNMPIYICIDR